MNEEIKNKKNKNQSHRMPKSLLTNILQGLRKCMIAKSTEVRRHASIPWGPYTDHGNQIQPSLKINNQLIMSI